jgi:Eukaryotic membrane protein family
MNSADEALCKFRSRSLFSLSPDIADSQNYCHHDLSWAVAVALLIAGNFAEIKSTVFKKYNKPSLFKIVASDICERFKLALFLGLVLLLNFCQGMDSRKMSDYQRIAGLVWMSELLCDWLKHAFITKFNFIPSTVYPEYGLLLAGDVTGIGHEGVNLDHSHAVVRIFPLLLRLRRALVV